MLSELDQPHPCRRCGGTNFDQQPRLHSAKHFYELATWPVGRGWHGVADDATFLRINGINPEEGDYDFEDVG